MKADTKIVSCQKLNKEVYLLEHGMETFQDLINEFTETEEQTPLLRD